MKQFIFGGIIGSLLTLIAMMVSSDLFYAQTKYKLIDQWRQVEVGMERKSVIKLLGEPGYDIKPGDGFPTWAEDPVPGDYSATHGLLVFIVDGPGPQLLLVYLDTDGRVSFVSSTHT